MSGLVPGPTWSKPPGILVIKPEHSQVPIIFIMPIQASSEVRLTSAFPSVNSDALKSSRWPCTNANHPPHLIPFPVVLMALRIKTKVLQGLVWADPCLPFSLISHYLSLTLSPPANWSFRSLNCLCSSSPKTTWYSSCHWNVLHHAPYLCLPNTNRSLPQAPSEALASLLMEVYQDATGYFILGTWRTTFLSFRANIWVHIYIFISVILFFWDRMSLCCLG